METSVIFALGAAGVWAASQRVLASQMESNPSMSMAYTNGVAAQKLNIKVEDPRRKNTFTSAEFWNLMDEKTYNDLRFNAMLSRHNAVINWWDAGELNQMPPQHIMKPLVQYSGGPEQ